MGGLKGKGQAGQRDRTSTFQAHLGGKAAAWLLFGIIT